jgi:hypothetical protein
MIVLERWIENLRCPVCRKTGAARLSQADGWSVHVDNLPDGFYFIQSENCSNLLLFMRQPRRTMNPSD